MEESIEVNIYFYEKLQEIIYNKWYNYIYNQYYTKNI